MSDMVKRYNESSKLRVVQARQIPDLAVNFIDQNSQFQTQFKTYMVKGDPTTYTPHAIEYYDDELATIVIPDGFQPTETGINLNRWTSKKKYYNPGAPT